MEQRITKGRGAQLNPGNRFESKEFIPIWTDWEHVPEETDQPHPTRYTEVYPKTLVNKVDSPDIPASWSMNPYQGCEHGCVYCYARPTHEYWGYSAGKDFETQIMFKGNASQLLRKRFRSKTWKASPIMMSGNTDAYQIAERKFKLSRSLLEVCLEHKHPVGIITKNALVCRDMDLLKELASHGLVHVFLSVTTLNEDIRRTMEPRTSTSTMRLKAIEALSSQGIPTGVMFAPVIPGLNSSEVFNIAEASAKAGAITMGYTMLRLNGHVELLFEDWIRKLFPMKASRVMNLVASAQGGKVSNYKLGERMKGKGVLAQDIQQQIRLAKKKFGLDKQMPAFNLDAYKQKSSVQLNLF